MNGRVALREGRSADLRQAFGLFEQAIHRTARTIGAADPGSEIPESEEEKNWELERPLIDFMAAQEGCFWVAEEDSAMVGFARVVRFGGIEQLTEICVAPECQGRGIGRALMRYCWPETPTPELGRLIVAAGSPTDLTLYTDFAVMPATGHWHLEQRTEPYLERRSHEATDAAEPDVHVLETARAVAEWQRLEPPAIGHERPQLHEFFGRERTCLATLDRERRPTGLCWAGPRGYIGPGVGERPQDLVPVALAALDRVAKAQEPEELHLFCTTDSWWLLRRLRSLGFRVSWPSWVMCSKPLPGLDRYLPTRPALLL